MRKHASLLITLLALALFPGAVAAQSDYYWRASLVHEDTSNTSFRDRRCDPPAELAGYFGCVVGDDDRLIGAYGDFGSSLGGELALGVRHSPRWRSEIVVGRQSSFAFRGNANFIGTGADQPVIGSVSHTRIGLRGFADIAPFLNRQPGSFEPYVGAGVALVRNKVGTLAYEFPGLSNQPALTTVPGDSDTHLGWMATVGTGIRVSSQSIIDIGLVYSDHGWVSTGRDDIDIIRGGNRVAQVAVESTRARLRSYGLIVGLRMDFR